MREQSFRYQWRALAVTWGVVLAAVGLAGCDLDKGGAGVASGQSSAVRRFDHFQSVTDSGRGLVAVGAFGVVEVSADGGSTWARREVAGAPGLIKVATCGDGSLAALDFDGAVWRAGADAATWTAAKLPATDAVLDLACTGDNHLWVVGARGAILASRDGGKSWTDQSLAEDIQLLNVQFPTPAVGVISGEFGRVLLTSDGGAKWREGGSLGPDFYPQGMDFADAQHGLVVGLGGAVLETLDGGVTWKRDKAPTEAPLYGVAATLPGGPVVVGAAGSVFRRVGSAWRPVGGIPLTDFRGIARTGSGAILAGAGVLLPLTTEALSSGTN